MDNLLGNYGIMHASEQEQDQNVSISVKALRSIVGDEGLGQEPGTVSVAARHSECIYASQPLAPVGGDCLEDVG